MQKHVAYIDHICFSKLSLKKIKKIIKKIKKEEVNNHMWSNKILTFTIYLVKPLTHFQSILKSIECYSTRQYRKFDWDNIWYYASLMPSLFGQHYCKRRSRFFFFFWQKESFFVFAECCKRRPYWLKSNLFYRGIVLQVNWRTTVIGLVVTLKATPLPKYYQKS